MFIFCSLSSVWSPASLDGGPGLLRCWHCPCDQRHVPITECNITSCPRSPPCTVATPPLCNVAHHCKLPFHFPPGPLQTALLCNRRDAGWGASKDGQAFMRGGPSESALAAGLGTRMFFFTSNAYSAACSCSSAQQTFPPFGFGNSTNFLEGCIPSPVSVDRIEFR